MYLARAREWMRLGRTERPSGADEDSTRDGLGGNTGYRPGAKLRLS